MLAEKFGRSIQETQDSVTSTEFVEWMMFEQMRMEQPTRDQYYLSRLALEIRAIFHKSPGTLKIEDFLLKFGSAKKETEGADPQSELAKSKSAWASWAARFGFRKREKPPEYIP